MNEKQNRPTNRILFEGDEGHPDTQSPMTQVEKNNRFIWDALKRPPKDALKKITGGRLRGMTDISPQWRYEAATEHFGPCGIGWKYEIENLWTESGSDNQIFAFAKVNLFYKRAAETNSPLPDDDWSSPIPGIGGSMLVAKEKDGLYSNDEAYKMAVTDALTNALKMIGVAADIYRGMWDGDRYSEPPTAITIDQQTEINDLLKETSVDKATVLEYANAQSVETISTDMYQKVRNRLLKSKEFMREPGMEG